MTITTRASKGAPLTHGELDGNFLDLDGRVQGDITYMTRNAANAIDVSNVTSKVYGTGGGWDGGYTHTLSGAARAAQTLVLYNNSGHPQTFQNDGADNPLDAYWSPFDLHHDRAAQFERDSLSGKFILVAHYFRSPLGYVPSIREATPGGGGEHVLWNSRRFMPEGVVYTVPSAVDIEVPANALPGSTWVALVASTGTTTVSVDGDVGSVNGVAGGSETATGDGAELRIYVRDNPGSAPVVIVKGDIV